MSDKNLEVTINGRKIGPTHPPYMIAELSGNHNGDINRALSIIESAHNSGADAVKLQTYTADTITIDHSGPGFVINGGLWDGKTLYDLYGEAHTPWDWHPKLFEKAHALGLTIFSSPFDFSAIEFLETLDVPAYKIASFEIVDLGLIEQAANTGKPLIISTGMANLKEISEAIGVASAGGGGLILLHCTSGYPTPISETNLQTINDMKKRFGLPVGLSDHTRGNSVAIAASAIGASVIEKHITLSRSDGGPDAEFSLEPHEFTQLCKDCRDAWEAIGHVNYQLEESEVNMIPLRRSLYAVQDVELGEKLTKNNIRSIRPGYGLAPRDWRLVEGRLAARNIKRGTPLSWDDIEDNP